MVQSCGVISVIIKTEESVRQLLFFILLLGKCFSILLFVVEMPFTLFFFWRVRFCSWFLRDHKVISDTGCGTVDKVM